MLVHAVSGVPNFTGAHAVVLIIPVVFTVSAVLAVAGIPANAGVLVVAFVLKYRYLENTVKHIGLFITVHLFWNPG